MVRFAHYCLVPSHYCNQWWLVVRYPGTYFDKIFRPNIFIHGNAYENVVCKMGAICLTPQGVNLWPSEAIWRHRSGLTLAQVMACCLTAPSHYLKQCLSSVIRLIGKLFYKTYLSNQSLKFVWTWLIKFPRGQCVNWQHYLYNAAFIWEFPPVSGKCDDMPGA